MSEEYGKFKVGDVVFVNNNKGYYAKVLKVEERYHTKDDIRYYDEEDRPEVGSRYGDLVTVKYLASRWFKKAHVGDQEFDEAYLSLITESDIEVEVEDFHNDAHQFIHDYLK